VWLRGWLFESLRGCLRIRAGCGVGVAVAPSAKTTQLLRPTGQNPVDQKPRTLVHPAQAQAKGGAASPRPAIAESADVDMMGADAEDDEERGDIEMCVSFSENSEHIASPRSRCG
jgi:hypothetical protein